MRTIIINVVLGVLMAGCTPAVTMPARVEIPVPVACPEPPPVTRPKLPIATLPPNATADQYVRAVEGSLEALMGYSAELERLLDGYRKGH